MEKCPMTWSQLLSEERQQPKAEKPESFSKFDMTEFDDDYLSIISSQAFRRLQDKTQVFPLDKSDFVRTRLTHSLEVSVIARQLALMCTQDTKNQEYVPQDFRDDSKLGDRIATVAACAGLLHDTGNPPFGHYGEEVLRDWFRRKLQDESFTFRGKPVGQLLDGVDPRMRKDFENFEGNAQGLRILSKARLRGDSHDVNLTYAVMNTLIKYPNPSTDFSKKDPDVKRHKMGYYYAEREIMEDICTATGTKAPDGSYVRHPIVYIMEAADDIAYATADLADSVKKGRFTVREFFDFYTKEADSITDSQLMAYIDSYKDDEALYSKLLRYLDIHKEMRAQANIDHKYKDQKKLSELDAERKALFQTEAERKVLAAFEKYKNSVKIARNTISAPKKAVFNGAGAAGPDSSVFRQALNHSDTPEEEFAIFENWLEGVRLWLMYGAQYTFKRNYAAIMDGTFPGELIEGNNSSDIIHILKKAMSVFVYDSHEIISLELSARRILESLLEDFVQAVLYADEPDEAEHMTTIDDRYVHMIPDNFKLDYLGAKKRIEDLVNAGKQSRQSADAEELYLRLLMVTDFISGMTDSYARNLYRITNGLD